MPIKNRYLFHSLRLAAKRPSFLALALRDMDEHDRVVPEQRLGSLAYGIFVLKETAIPTDEYALAFIV